MALFGAPVVQERCGSLLSDWEPEQQSAFTVHNQGDIHFGYPFRSEIIDESHFHKKASPIYHQTGISNALNCDEYPQVYARGPHVADGDPWYSMFADVPGVSDSLTELCPQSFQVFSPDVTIGHGFAILDHPYEDRGIPAPGLDMQSFNERPLHDCESNSISDVPQCSFADIYQTSSSQPSYKSEQLSPNSEDLYPDNPELTPHRQDVRFIGDLYTPTYVRGIGKMREGWCGICKPGRWLFLKNSAFWYDKAFTYGISAATGVLFDNPKETRTTPGQNHLCEGLCGTCGGWIALISNKRKGTSWFRHAYKCHVHNKPKDSPKKRRYLKHTRAKSSKTVKPAIEEQPLLHKPDDSIEFGFADNQESGSRLRK